MKIAVLDYTRGQVDIFDAPLMGSTEEIEEYLVNEKGYRLKDIYYMAQVKKVNVE